MFPSAKHATGSKSPRQRLAQRIFHRRYKPRSEECVHDPPDQPPKAMSEPSPPPPSSSTPSSLRKAQWRLFKHAPIANFFSKSQNPPASSIPRLTIRQPSMDHPDYEEPSNATPPSSDHDVAAIIETAPLNTAEPAPVVETTTARNMASRFPLWKLKPKTVSSTSSSDSAWKSMDSYTWRSAEGIELQLRGTRLEYLSETERLALQKICLQKLQRANLGCGPITKPKDGLHVKQKRQKMKQGGRSHTVGVAGVEKKVQQQKQSQEGSAVFGIPISACIQNDIRQEAEQRCRSLDLHESDPINSSLLVVPRSALTHRLSATSTKSTSSEPECSPSTSRHPSTSSTQGSQDAPRYPSSDNLLIPAFCGSPESPSHRTASNAGMVVVKQDSFEPRSPQVPRIVETCTEYLKRHGLTTVGIFRVAGSAKRCRQMRIELDSGAEVTFTDEEPQPHDIATLLKEYFRDLPNPLLTQELYAAFVAVGKLVEERKWDKIEFLRCLVGLLSRENSDTLLVLLKFLQEVARHAQDIVSDQGSTIAGNKMNEHNLATIFAPTILRAESSNPHTTLSDSDAVISVMEMMINYVDEIYTISRDTQQQMYQLLRETDVDRFDMIMNRLYSQSSGGDVDLSDVPPEATIFYSTHEEEFPSEVVRESDGSTTVKTRHSATHRIVYKVHRVEEVSTVEKGVELPFLFDDEDSATADLEAAPVPVPSGRVHRGPLAKLGNALSRFRTTDSPR